LHRPARVQASIPTSHGALFLLCDLSLPAPQVRHLARQCLLGLRRGPLQTGLDCLARLLLLREFGAPASATGLPDLSSATGTAASEASPPTGTAAPAGAPEGSPPVIVAPVGGPPPAPNAQPSSLLPYAQQQQPTGQTLPRTPPCHTSRGGVVIGDDYALDDGVMPDSLPAALQPPDREGRSGAASRSPDDHREGEGTSEDAWQPGPLLQAGGGDEEDDGEEESEAARRYDPGVPPQNAGFLGEQPASPSDGRPPESAAASAAPASLGATPRPSQPLHSSVRRPQRPQPSPPTNAAALAADTHRTLSVLYREARLATATSAAAAAADTDDVDNGGTAAAGAGVPGGPWSEAALALLGRADEEGALEGPAGGTAVAGRGGVAGVAFCTRIAQQLLSLARSQPGCQGPHTANAFSQSLRPEQLPPRRGVFPGLVTIGKLTSGGHNSTA